MLWPCFSRADSTVTSKRYVDTQFISDITTGEAPGTIDVTKNGTTTPVTIEANIVTSNDGTDGYVVNSVTVNPNDASQINIARSYVKVPVSAGAPSANTPTGFVEVWFE